ncbi:hypothetical protein ACMBCM_08290, partial [Spiroplasma sp. K1]
MRNKLTCLEHLVYATYTRLNEEVRERERERERERTKAHLWPQTKTLNPNLWYILSLIGGEKKISSVESKKRL